MNSQHQLSAQSHDWVPMRPCLVLMLALVIPSLAVSFWLFRIGLSPTLYWGVQVESFVYLNGTTSNFPTLWLNLTQLGDAYLLLPLLSFFIIAKPQVWAAFFGAIPLATFLTHGGKALAAVPRPAAALDPNLINILGETLTGRDSLPSGHTATVFVAGTIISLIFYFSRVNTGRWWVVPTVLAATLLLSVSRVAVGAHWPLDVFFGAVCGFLGGLSGIFLTQRYARWWLWLKQPKYWLMIGMIMLTWSLSLLPPLHSSASASTVSQWTAALVGIVCASKLIIRHFHVTQQTVQ